MCGPYVPVRAVRGRAHESAGVANLLINLDGGSAAVHTSFGFVPQSSAPLWVQLWVHRMCGE